MKSARKAIKQPPMLFKNSQELIRRIEREMNLQLICYWTSSRGNVCDNDVIALYELLQKIGKGTKIALFIKSYGGDVEAALKIVHLIRNYYHNVIAFVPLECASAATMIALGADEIRMGPLAYLTAIDSSLTHDLSPIDERNNQKVSVSQDELQRIVKLWNNNKTGKDSNPYSDIFKYIHPLVVGAIDRSSSLSTKICTEILSYHTSNLAQATKISKMLNNDYPSHSYPITMKEAKRIGINVQVLDSKINDLLLDLNGIYSEIAQRAITDFDECNYHDNEVANIIEAGGIQICYQNEKDWNYIKEERRWQELNDESSWRKIELVKGKQVKSILHIR
jgi:hypothetical protein